MGLDINLFRPEKGGNPDLIRESVKRRFQDPKIVDDVLALDEEWRKKRFACDQLRKERNAVNKEIGNKKKKNREDPCTDEVAKGKELDEKIAQAEQEEEPIMKELEKLVNKIGNLVHESVPIHKDEAHNEVVKTWGTIPDIKVTELPGKPGRAHHHEILTMIDGIEQSRGIKVAGHRGYYLKGYGALLNMALYTYGVNFLVKRGYTFMQPPFMMKRSVMAETAQLSDFDDQLYKVSGQTEDEDMYLIATAEQPLSALYRGEWLDPQQLPIQFAGLSSCFRKEAGAHGKETWGCFRVHQFEKVEQFCFTSPEKSWEKHEEMLKISEEFYQSLNLPYKVISIVSGALNDAAAKKYDLEAWFPGYNDYRELVSCSNCTDYQARALEIRYGNKKQNDTEKKYVHMLNGTLCATERTLCCILENYQTPEGVRVPEVLIPHVGTNFIPYVNPVPNQKEGGDQKKPDQPKTEKKPTEKKPAEKKAEQPAEKITEEK